MFVSCSVSELETTTFVLSASDLKDRFQIRKHETDRTLFLGRNTGCWKTADPFATLQTVLKFTGSSLNPATVFVHPTEYTVRLNGLNGLSNASKDWSR